MKRTLLKVLRIIGGIAVGAAVFVGMLWWVAQPYGLAPIARGLQRINWAASLSAWAFWGLTAAMQIALWAAMFRWLARLTPRRDLRD